MSIVLALPCRGDAKPNTKFKGKPMKSNNKEEEEEKKKNRVLKPKKPHFLRVIFHEDHLKEAKLEIPVKFMKNYGSDLQSSVLLKVPSGVTWKVDLVKRDGCTWFGKGWHEFSQYHSLAPGQMIIFRYDGRCGFDLVIFDLSASEIDYPCGSGNYDVGEVDTAENVGEPEMDNTKEQEDAPVEILGESCRSRKRKDRVPLERLGAQKMVKNHKNYRTRRAKGQECEEYSMYEELKSEEMARPKRIMQPLTAEEKKDALERARTAFKSENPFFMVAIQPSYLRRHGLPLPDWFCKKHIQPRCSAVTLFAVNGRTWSIQLSNANGPRFYRRRRWHEFAENNRLEVGDVCVFELRKTSEISFNVVLFRFGKDETSTDKIEQMTHGRSPPIHVGKMSFTSETREACQGKNIQRVQSLSRKSGISSDTRTVVSPRNNPNRAKRDANSRFVRIQRSTQVTTKKEPQIKDENDDDADLRPGNPFFKVKMFSSYAQRDSLAIPVSFTRQHLKMQHTDLILRGADGRTWRAKCAYRGSTASIFHGWNSFARDNNLQTDDVCHFELINCSEPTFRVTIAKS